MVRSFLVFLAALALPSAVFAQEDSEAIEQASYERAAQSQYVLLGTMAAADVFAPEFLGAVSEDQLKAIIVQLAEQNGPLLSVDELSYKGDGAIEFDLVFEQARAAAVMHVSADEPHKVIGFRITGVRRIDDTPQKILEDFAALPGAKGLGIYLLGPGGPQPILTEKPTQQLAIGSAFKLYVLSALAQEVKAGRRKWDEVVRLDAYSVPSGQMQNWPLGTPVTLQTAATMMISISDNTATDLLMRMLGRDAIAKEVLASGHSDPSRMLPMLTTVDLFALKTGDSARITAYLAADDAAQAKLLDDWALKSGDAKPYLAPIAADTIEWFASAEDIAGIFTRLRDVGDPVALDILKVNALAPGSEASYWDYIGYKGGSEPGVINLSWLLKDKQDRWFVIAASWNDPSKVVDDAGFVAIGARMLGMLHQ